MLILHVHLFSEKEDWYENFEEYFWDITLHLLFCSTMFSFLLFEFLEVNLTLKAYPDVVSKVLEVIYIIIFSALITAMYYVPVWWTMTDWWSFAALYLKHQSFSLRFLSYIGIIGQSIITMFLMVLLSLGWLLILYCSCFKNYW